jgi:hypothetical protein
VRASILIRRSFPQTKKINCEGWRTIPDWFLMSPLTSFYTESLQLADFQRFALPDCGFSAIFASY